jgi:hypothetical protein
MDKSPFTTPRGSLSSSIGNSAELEANLTLSDKLRVFKSSTFDPSAYVASKSRSMNEKVYVCVGVWARVFYLYKF